MGRRKLWGTLCTFINCKCKENLFLESKSTLCKKKGVAFAYKNKCKKKNTKKVLFQEKLS